MTIAATATCISDDRIYGTLLLITYLSSITIISDQTKIGEGRREILMGRSDSPC